MGLRTKFAAPRLIKVRFHGAALAIASVSPEGGYSMDLAMEKPAAAVQCVSHAF